MFRSSVVRVLALAVLLVGGGCSQGTEPTAATPAAIQLQRQDQLLGGVFTLLNRTVQTVGRLAYCLAKPYDSTAVAVGPAGATLHAGLHTLVIPAGALNGTVRISMVAPSQDVSSARFHPEGLVFNSSARPTLTLSTDGCSLGNNSTTHIEYVDEQLKSLEVLTNSGLTSSSVSAPIQHFSRYAVAW